MRKNYWMSTAAYAPSDMGAQQNQNDQNNNNNNQNNQNNNNNNNNNNQGQQGQQNDGTQNNGTPQNKGMTQKALDAFADLWQPKKKDPPNNNMQHSSQQLQNTQQPPEDKLGNYLKQKDYYQGADMQKLQTAFEARNWQDFSATFSDVLRNFHRGILGETARMGESFRDQAIESGASKATTNYQTEQLYRDLFSSYPELKSAAIMPVAKGVLGRFIEAGKTAEEAIKATNDYFIAVGTQFNKAPPNQQGMKGGQPPKLGPDGTELPAINFDDILKLG